MKNYIVIDGGTTNTRVYLVSDGNVIDTIKLPMGAQKSINNTDSLVELITGSIEDLLAGNQFHESDIIRILASGMITSEYGLYQVAHIALPVGIKELNQSMKTVELKSISSIPFVFIPGVKMVGNDFLNTDMMRGEETELMGIAEGMKKCIVVLPGSHSKIIEIDANGRIDHITSALTGEMIGALSADTILKDTVNLNTEFDEMYLRQGFETCQKVGINEALFKTRVLKNIFSCNQAQIYGFFMGVVLYGEINRIISTQYKEVYVGGKRQLKEAIVFLLKNFSDKIVKRISDEQSETAQVKGIIKIYEYDGNRLK